LIPNPIIKVLSMLSCHEVRHLHMGGQACVFYGAAEFSRDCDIVMVADDDNLTRLKAALDAALEQQELTERNIDKAYWQPLKDELEKLRFAKRGRHH